MARKRMATVQIEWTDGTKETMYAEDEKTVRQHYKQLNFVDTDGKAVAVNLHATRYVKVNSDSYDFNDQF